MTPDNAPPQLSLIGYWSISGIPAERSRGWPDPNDLKGGWEANDRRAALAKLRCGKVFRVFSGTHSCRICGMRLGASELTDGTWAWPEGLDHYVESHDVRLPEAFVTASRSSGQELPLWLASLKVEHWVQSGPESAVPLLPTATPGWLLSDVEWLDWAAANTPAHPSEDAISVDDARAVCRQLSHETWNVAVEEVWGRWQLRLGNGAQATRIYLERSSTRVLERRLLSMRVADPARILDIERANGIAAEFDGAWGATRVVARHPQAWLIWVKPPEGEWPSQDELERVVKASLGFGWECAHPGGGSSFVAPPADETAWRWMLACRREARETPTSEVAESPARR